MPSSAFSPHPSSTLFPYTTLFRSDRHHLHRHPSLRRSLLARSSTRPKLLLRSRLEPDGPVLHHAHGVPRGIRPHRGRSQLYGAHAVPEPSHHPWGLSRRESRNPRPADLPDRGAPSGTHAVRRRPLGPLLVDHRPAGNRPRRVAA